VRIDLVFPRFKLLSGAERLILGLATALQKAGHEPRIVCHQFDDSCRPRLSPGVELVCSGKRLDWFRNRYLNAIADYGRTWQLDGLLDGDADARVLFGPALPLAGRLRSGVGPPLLYFCYEPPRALYQDRGIVLERLGAMRFVLSPLMTLYRRIDKRLVAAVDQVCTNSDFSAERIRACYGRTAPVITHGVDRQRFDSLRPTVAAHPPTLLTVNYLHPRKRVDLAIEAMALLVRGAQNGPALLDGLRLHIIGDGPERERLGALVESLGVSDRVAFLGFVADDDLPGQYWASIAYVHTTKDESLGLSVIEAAYCARPIVAVNEGGVTRTVHDEHTGYLVAPSAEGIADGVRRLLALPDHGAHMGELGRQRVQEMYSWEQGAEDLIAAISAVTR